MAKNKIRQFLSVFTLVFVFGLVTVNAPAVFADPPADDVDSSLSSGDIDVSDNPIMIRLQQIVNFLSIGVGIVITLSVVFAGFQYITSRGDPSKTKAAIERLWNAGIAIFLYVFMYIIISWLIPGR